MADNYLETRYEEVFGTGAKPKSIIKRTNVSLNTMLVKNRSTRRYRQDVVIPREQLKEIVSVNTKIASAMNRQVLRFRLVESEQSEADRNVNSKDKALLLRDILFREQMRSEAPSAFIIVYSSISEDRYVDIDLGISLQSMALKAVELGFNCLIKGDIDVAKITELFADNETGSRLCPLAVLCIGKSAESVYLKPTDDVSALEPYTKEGVHYVPKLQVENLLAQP